MYLQTSTSWEANFWFSRTLTWMRIKTTQWCGYVIRQTGSNSDREKSNFTGGCKAKKKNKLHFYRCICYYVSLWEEECLSQCASPVVITWFGCYVKLASKPGLFPCGLALALLVYLPLQPCWGRCWRTDLPTEVLTAHLKDTVPSNIWAACTVFTVYAAKTSFIIKEEMEI